MDWLNNWINGRVAQSKFHTFIKKIPIVKKLASHDGRKIYDLVSGFVFSQILLAVVELKLIDYFLTGDKDLEELAEFCRLDRDRTELLCNAAVAIGLLNRRSDSQYSLTRLGAAIKGVHGLEDMILHHKVFYSDLRDPLKLLRGEFSTELSNFWSYVAKDKKVTDKVAMVYSDLMGSSQHIVAEETLSLVKLDMFNNLLDIGGGDGTFLKKVRKSYPKINLSLFDLPSVAKTAKKNFERDEQLKTIKIISGNFKKDHFPKGYELIFFNRVFYDHDDETISLLLRKSYTALNPGGTIIISEPMAGLKKPTRSGDAYFGFYTLAMKSGKPRSERQHLNLLEANGYTSVKSLSSINNYITSVVVAKKPKK